MNLKKIALGTFVALSIAAPFVTYQIGANTEKDKHKADYIYFSVSYCDKSFQLNSRIGERAFQYYDHLDSLPNTVGLDDNSLKQRTRSLVREHGFNIETKSYSGWDFGTLSGCYGQYELNFTIK